MEEVRKRGQELRRGKVGKKVEGRDKMGKKVGVGRKERAKEEEAKKREGKVEGRWG